MQSSFRDSPWRRVLTIMAGCAVLACALPGLAARAPTAKIEVRNKGDAQWNFNAGTQVLEREVTLRQAPDTLIRADRAEGSNLPDGNYDNGHWTLAGSVHIEFNGTVLDANSATVVFADGRIHSIVVQGAPAKFSHPTGATGERNEGRANTIAYDGPRRQIRFAGHTAYAFGPYEGVADKPLIYSLDSTEIASEKTPGDNSRITFTFRNMRASAKVWRANIDAGTQLLEQDVELSQAPNMIIRAGKAEGSNLTQGYGDGRWTLTQKVRIDHDEAELEADSATLTLAGGKAGSIRAHGNPIRFSYPTRVAGRRFEGRAESISFDGASRQVRVVGHPSRYTLGRNPFSSDKPLLYDLDAGLLSTEDSGDPDARVRGTWSPDQRVPTPRLPDRGSAR